MILLLGGTSETAPIALGLAHAGYSVLVSCATGIDLDTGSHRNITRRAGPLDTTAFISLIRSHNVHLLVDATHPYADTVRRIAQEAAQKSGIPYLAYLRPGHITEETNVIRVGGHREAAQRAFAYGRPVFITTGAKNIAPYADEAKKTGIPLIARILPETASIEACRLLGLPDNHIIAQRGPFSTEENREIIERFSVGVLVTKDSGVRGGVREKIEAARLTGCAVVIVKRPNIPTKEGFDDIDHLISHIVSTYPKEPGKDIC